MNIVGCDFHPGWQQVAVLDSETGEVSEHKLDNGSGEAERFYRQLEAPALIGLEASGNSQWFEDLLAVENLQQLQQIVSPLRCPTFQRQFAKCLLASLACGDETATAADRALRRMQDAGRRFRTG